MASNAFAHGELRAVKDQLAAMTTERNHLQSLTVVNESLPVPALRRQLDAAQARESKLREALELIYNGSTPAKAIARFALKAHTDDSALMERLKQERDRCVEAVKRVYFAGKDTIIKEIRSMT